MGLSMQVYDRGSKISLKFRPAKRVCQCGEEFRASPRWKCLNCKASLLGPDCENRCDDFDLEEECRHRKVCSECKSPLLRNQRDVLACRGCGKPPEVTCRCKCGAELLSHFSRNISGATVSHYCPHCSDAVKALISNSGLPPEFRHMELPQVRRTGYNAPLVQHVQEIDDEPTRFRRWVVIYGPTGAGKTMMASLLAKGLMRRMQSVQFVEFTRYVDRLRSGIDFNHPMRDEIRRFNSKVMSIGRLVIDDLRDRAYTPFERKQLYRLIKHRALNRLSTIITTQLTFNDMQLRFDPDTASLIKGQSGSWFCPGLDDMRGYTK